MNPEECHRVRSQWREKRGHREVLEKPQCGSCLLQRQRRRVEDTTHPQEQTPERLRSWARGRERGGSGVSRAL